MLMLLRPLLDPIAPRKTVSTTIPPHIFTILVMRGGSIAQRIARITDDVVAEIMRIKYHVRHWIGW